MSEIDVGKTAKSKPVSLRRENMVGAKGRVEPLGSWEYQAREICTAWREARDE